MHVAWAIILCKVPLRCSYLSSKLFYKLSPIPSILILVYPFEIDFLCYRVHLVLQPMNAFRYGSQAVQHSQTMIATSSSNGPLSGVAKTDDAVGGKMGKPL